MVKIVQTAYKRMYNAEFLIPSSSTVFSGYLKYSSEVSLCKYKYVYSLKNYVQAEEAHYKYFSKRIWEIFPYQHIGIYIVFWM